MTAPGLLFVLALPALGIVKAWPEMSWFDRALLVASGSCLALSIRPVLGRRVVALYFGRFDEFTTFEKVLLLAPAAGLWFPMTHDLLAPAYVVLMWAFIRVADYLKGEDVRESAVPPLSPMRDRIEPPLTLASAVEPWLPRRWRDRRVRVRYSRQRTPARPVHGPSPPHPPDADR